MPEDGNRVPKTGITIGTKVKMQKEQSDKESRDLHFPVERSKSAVQICIHHTLFTGLSGIGPRRWTHDNCIMLHVHNSCKPNSNSNPVV
jgi:hypothetical protein